MFILVLMLRHSITKLRQLGLAGNLVLDRHIYFHKVTGRLIVVYSVVHTLCHFGNLFHNLVWHPDEFVEVNGLPRPSPQGQTLASRGFSWADWVFTAAPGYFGLVAGAAFPTGVCLVIILLVMTVCSMKWVRKGGYFEVRIKGCVHK